MNSFFNSFTKLFGNKYKKEIKNIEPIIDEINILLQSIQKLSNDKLRQKTTEFILKIQNSYTEETSLIKKLTTEK